MKKLRRHSGLFWLAALLALVVLGCGGNDGPPSDAVVVDVTANTSLTPWLEEAIAQFNESEAVTSEDNPIFVQLVPADAGQAIVDITAGAEPDLWWPTRVMMHSSTTASAWLKARWSLPCGRR
jgi:ABC-type glycerol-3-phosphate transport system substrate-binding protein